VEQDVPRRKSMKNKANRKLFFLGIGAAILMAFSVIFAGCPGAIDDLTDVNDKIKGNTITVMPAVGALDVLNNSSPSKTITKIEITTTENGVVVPVRTITGNIESGGTASTFLPVGTLSVTLTINGSEIIPPQNVVIELDMVTLLTFSVSGGENAIVVGPPLPPPPGTFVEKGAVKVTNISAPTVATITNIRITNEVTSLESIYTAAITGGGPSWVAPLETGHYKVSITTNGGATWSEDTLVQIIAPSVIELKYGNGHLVETNDVTTEMGSLKVINNSDAFVHTISNIKMENATTHESVMVPVFILGGSSWTGMFPVGVYELSISEDNGANFWDTTKVDVSIYRNTTSEVMYGNGTPDDGGGGGDETRMGAFMVKNMISGGVTSIDKIKIEKRRMVSGLETWDPVAEYTAEPFLPLPYNTLAPHTSLDEFVYLLGTYRVTIFVDGGWSAATGTVTLTEGITLVLTWTNASVAPGITQETDKGWVQLVRSYTGASAPYVLDGVYKESQIVGFWLTNTQTGIQYQVYDGVLLLDKTTPEMSASPLTNLKDIPVGDYTALIQYKQTPGASAVSFIVNDTDPDHQPVTVTVTKNTRTILYHTIPNKYWDMVNASGQDGSTPDGRLEITNSASNANYGIVIIEIWSPLKTGNMGTSSMTGRTKVTEWTTLIPYGGVHTFTLPSGGYSIRLKRAYTTTWYGYGANTWKTVTVSPGRTKALYWASSGTQLRP
jgi:hypothetical protein